MRAFAWVLVAVGLGVALAAPLTLSTLAADAAREHDLIPTTSPLQRYTRRELAERSLTLASWQTWSIGIGAAVAAFGVLVLAIRRPEKAEEGR